jgi:hypothetical protein
MPVVPRSSYFLHCGTDCRHELQEFQRVDYFIVAQQMGFLSRIHNPNRWTP